jgi:glucosamine--fructose-6-phosphate aminotransferase (isomerizing)
LGTLYHADINLNGALVIGVSQSGRSPDICDVLQRARTGGALTLAITNNPSSPLAQAAALHIDISAAQELSVAATKSYTNQLASIAMLISALSGDHSLRDAIATVPTHMQAALTIPDTTIAQAARILRSISHRHQHWAGLAIRHSLRSCPQNQRTKWLGG